MMKEGYHAPGMQDFLASMAGKGGCWNWPKYCNRDGYGLTKLNGKTSVATRVAYLLAFGEFDRCLYILHHCDNPRCVRPDHLFLGTAADNAADAKNKDRHSRGIRNGFAKLNDDAVRDIRNSPLTQWQLADKYGVWQGTIWQVIHGHRWQHVTD